jgi:hypothetical protein
VTGGLFSLLLALSLLACGGGDDSSLGQAHSPDPDEQGGAAGSAGAAAGHGGQAGAPVVVPPSCLARTPGADLACGQTADHDCCESPLVPGGSAFLNFNGLQKEKSHKDWPFSVSSFRLDKYEVTVGRFRAFLHVLPSWRPKADEGAHPLIHGSGWDPSWPLVSSESEFAAALDAFNQTPMGAASPCKPWKDASETSENLPMGCLTWYELFAFCAWDGGRLPTDHEWFFAAAGGSQQRAFPWSSPPSSTSTDGIFPGIPYPGYKQYLPVGSFPRGEARWGQADLLGNVSEWVLDDSFSPDQLTFPCSDCAQLSGADEKTTRDDGWSFSSVVADEGSVPTGNRYGFLGGRCARHLP